MSDPVHPPVSALEKELGYGFRDSALLELALMHPSYSHETDDSTGNERLEFLGDAVLDLAVAQLLYEGHPDWSEGELTRGRAALVNARSLARCARILDLGRHARLGRTEQRSGGAEKTSILANVLEAVVGAIYLDGGLEPVRVLARRLFGAVLERGAPVVEPDAKTRFQEWAHGRFQTTPGYRTLADSGDEEHGERFTAAVSLGEEVWGMGRGRTKRAAERAAAREALQRAEREGG